jgi:hypothetical protein
MLISSASMAADRIEIEVATEPGLSPTAPQQWAQLLGKLDISRVRIRGIRSGDVPNMAANQASTGTHYRLLAILDRRGQLLLPGAAFKRSELQSLRSYLERLQTDGLENFGAERGRFDLTTGQLQVVLNDLSQAVSHSTQSQSVSEVLTQVSRQLQTPIVIDTLAQRVLAGNRPTNVELQGMAMGTALALLLRTEGLAMTPEKMGKPLQLRVAPIHSNRQSWPVGWKSPVPARQLHPKLYKRLTIEIDGYSLNEAFEALQPRLTLPYRWDWWILAQRQIVPENIQVSLPRGKTYLKRAADRLLSQARLTTELRVDERGNPFFWVTQFGKESSRAERLDSE